MPKMKLCPNRKSHKPVSYKVVGKHTITEPDGTEHVIPIKRPIYASPNEKQEYKTFTLHHSMDRLKRVYYRTVNRYGRTMWIRTEYWYCPYCDLVCHESHDERSHIGEDEGVSNFLIKNKAFP